MYDDHAYAIKKENLDLKKQNCELRRMLRDLAVKNIQLNRRVMSLMADNAHYILITLNEDQFHPYLHQ